jgi:hypothetical protein
MNPYFGDLGDIWKHLPLAEILQLNPPRHYWETHAGSASYPLTTSPARQHGVLHFLEHAPGEPELQDSSYLRALQEDPDLYPGSPLLAMRALGKKASYIFCDIDPESAANLRTKATGLDARVVEDDGVSAIADEIQHTSAEPGDVLVLIDPFLPFERITPDSQTPIELGAALAAAGYRLMFWYRYDTIDQRGWARDQLASLVPGVELWCGDTLMPAPFIFPNGSGPWGCGIVLANATPAEQSACQRLGYALERISASDLLSDNIPPRLSFQLVR